jgi:hypothetical protein
MNNIYTKMNASFASGTRSSSVTSLSLLALRGLQKLDHPIEDGAAKDNLSEVKGPLCIWDL